MSYPLPAGARAWQEKLRRFVDEELIPWEVEAEMNGGELPPEVRDRHRRRARELGLYGMDMPKALGGSELTLHTDNGVVTLAGAGKSAAASVVNGNIDATNVTGPLDIRTVNGNLTVKNAYSSIKAESVAGNIHIETSKVGGHWGVSNTAGNVYLAWPEKADVQVEAGTTFGKPETDFPLTVKGGRVSGTIGAGTYRIEASSLAGLSLQHSN